MNRNSCPLRVLAALSAIALAPAPLASAEDSKIKAALTFHASFDAGTDADFAKGDAALYTWLDRKKLAGKAGLHTGGKSVRVGEGGKFGGALEFKAKDSPWIFYDGADNLAFRTILWAGSVSLWLRCDPVEGLAPGYCDPVQITPRKWNDAAFFLDFDKEGSPREFRLGAFSDLKLWNPEGKEVPEEKRPLVTAKRPEFGADRWTHVVFTWEGFNTSKKDAIASLYINGKLDGTLTGWDQWFRWEDDEKVRLLLGLNYIGGLDEFSCFDRALSADEVARVFALERGVSSLLK